MNTQARLQAYLSYRGLSNKQFEALCGLGNGTAASICDKTRETTFNRISKGCPDLNLDWLRSGEGEMLRPFISQTVNDNNVFSATGNASSGVPAEVHNLALQEISEMRKLLAESVRSTNELSRRLMALLEKMNNN